jgi:hypothetical protein
MRLQIIQCHHARVIRCPTIQKRFWRDPERGNERSIAKTPLALCRRCSLVIQRAATTLANAGARDSRNGDELAVMCELRHIWRFALIFLDNSRQNSFAYVRGCANTPKIATVATRI